MRFESKAATDRFQFVVQKLLTSKGAITDYALAQMMFKRYGRAASAGWLTKCRAEAMRLQRDREQASASPVEKVPLKLKSQRKSAVRAPPSKVQQFPLPEIETPAPAFPPELKPGLEKLTDALQQAYTYGDILIRLLPDGSTSIRYELTPKAPQMRGELKINR